MEDRGKGEGRQAPLSERIRQRVAQMSPAERRVAMFVAGDPVRAAMLPVSEIAAATGTSEATVVRASRSLGFRGFVDMRDAVREEVASGRYVSRWRSGSDALRGHGSVLGPLFERARANIEQTAARVSEEHFARAAHRLANASEIYCLGLRSSSALALLAYVGFNTVLGNAHLLSLGVGDLFDRLPRLTADSALVAFSMARYTVQTVQACAEARQQGAYVCVITDHPASPAARVADDVLVVDTTSEGPIDSPIGAVALTYALVTQVALLAGDRASRRAEQLESVARRYALFWQDEDRPGLEPGSER